MVECRVVREKVSRLSFRLLATIGLAFVSVRASGSGVAVVTSPNLPVGVPLDWILL